MIEKLTMPELLGSLVEQSKALEYYGHTGVNDRNVRMHSENIEAIKAEILRRSDSGSNNK
jgi:hypothetical protein